MRPVLLACLLWVAAWAQDATFRSDVSLVRVDVEVRDSTGKILEGLRKEDFRILDQGQPVPLTDFTFEAEPLDLILLFDLSGPMRGKLLKLVRAVELGFHELKPGDRVSVMAGPFSAFEILPFTPDLDRVNQAIVIDVLKQKFGGQFILESAATVAAGRFRSEPKSKRRRAVLAIEDKSEGRPGGEGGAIRALWESDAALGELVLGGGTPRGTISAQTGGSVVVAGSEPGPAFQEAVQGLRRRYTLYYAQPDANPGTERKMTVSLAPTAPAGARVRARAGYVVPR